VRPSQIFQEVTAISSTNLDNRLEGLRRQAAELGPGYQGRRREASRTERAALIAEFRSQGESPPPYLDIEPTWIERRAKLFEAGDYPDKGVTVTPRDLDRMVENFDLPVPILIEHAESPLELGFLTSVTAEDGELFGVLSLTEEAHALIERSGAKSLSVGLSADLGVIREVSLVRNPRVPSAQMFNDQLCFQIDVDLPVDWRAKYEAAIAAQRHDATRDRVHHWVASGKITPAQAPYARALLDQESGVQFDGDLVPIRDLVEKLIASQPCHAMLGEVAPQPAEDASSVLMLPEEVAFYRKHFPEVSLESIAQKRAPQT